MAKSKSILLLEEIEPRIQFIRNQRVMIDADLAQIFGVTTKRLNEQIKRNRDRFPRDFLFELTTQEKTEVVANCDHLARLKFSRSLPYAFTEHGAIMAATVLNSPRAVEMSVFVVRAFIKMREYFASHKELAQKLRDLELQVGSHAEAIQAMVSAIEQLMQPPLEEPKKRRIGFQVEEE